MAARTLPFSAPLDISRLAVGDRVQHELLVYDRAEKRKTDGEPYVVLTLGNASGRIETAPVWSNQIEWADGAMSGRVVQAIGQVSLFGKNGTAKRQLQLTAPVRTLPDELVNVEDFLPRVTTDPTRLWDWIDSTRSAVESAKLRKVLDLFYGDDDFRERFERAPGSTAGHHAKIGGLLMHVFEVTNIARQTARTMMRANVDLVVAGALLHDVGKVEAYTIGPGGFTYTPCGLLVGHVVLGVMMLERRIAALGEPVCTEGQLLDLQHMILSHHGKLEFGSPVEPMTVEAEIVHWADEASAKANDMLESLDDADAFPDGGEFSKRVWRVGRRVWKRPHGWE
jgi:3'-5' exoribonuclease